MFDRRTFLKLATAFTSYFLLARNSSAGQDDDRLGEPYADVWGFGGGGLAFPAWFPVNPRVPVPEKHRLHLPLVMNG